MKWKPRNFALMLFLLSTSVLIHAAEKRISKSALPAAVAKTAEEQSKGAIVKGYSQDSENGQIEYEVEMMVNGHTKAVGIGSAGNVLEVEEQIEMNALSSPVEAAIKAKAGSGNVRKVESITKNGAIVAYEAQVTSNGKNREIQVGPHGETLAHEE